jgi:hypothetical protein
MLNFLTEVARNDMGLSCLHMGANPALPCRLVFFDRDNSTIPAEPTFGSLRPEVARSGPLRGEGGRG